MAELLNGNQQWVDSSGAPLLNGKVYIGVKGSDPVTTPLSIFSDRALSVALANPQTLDSQGFSTNKIWLSGRYSIRVETSAAVLVKQELDNGEVDQAGITTLSSVAGSNVITANNTPTITAYTDNAQFVFQVALINTTAAVTLNVDGIGAKSIKKNFDEDPGIGEFHATQIIIVAYNSGRGIFEWVNQNTDDYQPGFINGLQLSNDSGDATNDIAVAVGSCVNSADQENIDLTSILTKKIDANWAVGDDAGGFPSGLTLTNDTWYHFFIIKRTDTGVVDAGFDTSLTATNLLSDATGYDAFRRIGSIRRATALNRLFFQTGDLFLWDVSILDISGSSSLTRVLLTVTTPLGLKTEVLLAYNISIPTSAAYDAIFGDPDRADTTPTASIYEIALSNSSAGTIVFGGNFSTTTNLSSQVAERSDAVRTRTLSNKGYIDLRGKK